MSIDRRIVLRNAEICSPRESASQKIQKKTAFAAVPILVMAAVAIVVTVTKPRPVVQEALTAPDPLRAVSIYVNPPNAEVGKPYRFQLEAHGGNPPYVWSISSGRLPDGLTLTKGGLISGVPRGTGTSTFTVQVVDRSGNTSGLAFGPAANSSFEK